ncbi:MAG: hypothetical protein C4K58_06525 [Flavobacteriaceae bacterium]|nr:MAG: hypothetical protein C4K58_06525 [Flavobacteriaceae bacterium]
MVEKGQRYKITAKGQWQDATFPPTDANGFVGFTLPMKVGNNLKVLPEENYMMLLAQVGKIYTPIGVEREFTPQNSGELNFLTNDARFFFGSNHGDIEVTVERLD